MGKASITIAIGALWNGSSTLTKVQSELSSMAARISADNRSTTQSLALQSRQFQDLGTSVYDAGTKIAHVGDTLTNDVTKPMAVLGGYCVSQATKFDTSVANLNKTANLTSGELESLAKEALRASTTQPVSPDAIMNAEALGAQLGISNDRLKEFSDVANGLDIATNMDMETAGKEMAQFANITGMSQDKLENYGSTLVDLGNNFATTESDISHMSLRLAGISTVANFTESDIMGISAAMSSMGIKAEAGGSSMTRIVSSISKAVATGGDDLQAYADAAGITAEEFAQKWETRPVEALEALMTGINRSVDAGTNMDTILASLGVDNIRIADTFRRLAGNSSVLTDAVSRANTAWDQNTALTTEVDKRNQSLESRFATLKNKATEAAIEIGTPLAEALLDVADDMQPVIDGIAGACQAFADMDKGSQQAALTLAGIAFAAGPVLKVTGSLVQGLGNVTTAFGNFQSSAAIYGDALDTVDGRQMRVYASSKELSAQLGIAKNKAADAAGGVKNYVSAYEKMEDAARTVSKTTEALNANAAKLEEVAAEAGEGSKQYEKAEKKIEALNRKLEDQRDRAKEAYTENATLISKWSGSTSEAEKMADGVSQLSGSLEDVKANFKAAGTEAEGLGKKASSSASALSKIKDSASNLGTGISNGLKLAGASALEFGKNLAMSALTTAGISLAIAGITTVVGFLVDKYQEAETRSQNLAKATDGLISASSGIAQAAGGATVSMNEYTVSVDDARKQVDSALESQAKLADTMSNTNTTASAQMTQLTAAYNTIQQLGNQSDLTAAQQGALQAAVKTVNDQCGTQITVTDAANGKLADENGAIQDVTASLGDYIDKKLQQIQLEAQQQNLSALYQQKTEDVKALAAAQKAYNDQLQDEDSWTADYMAKYAQYGMTIDGARAAYEQYKASLADTTGLNDAKAALDADNTSIENVNANIASSISVADGAAASLADYAMASGTVSAAIDQVGGNINDFANDLAACGVSVQDFKSLNDEQLTQLVTSWDGTQQSLAAALDQMGITFSDKGTSAVDALAQSIQSGQVSVETATAALQSASTGDWSPMIKAFSDAGIQMPQSLAQGLTDGSYQATDAASYMMSAIALKLTNGDVQKAAEICGGQLNQGLVDGITSNTLPQETAALLGDDTIQAAQESLGVHSPSVYMEEAGEYVDEGLANGINGNSGIVTDAANGLGELVKNGVNGIIDFFTGQGSGSSMGLADGLSSNSGSVSSAAQGLDSAARTPVSGIDQALGMFGSNAGSSFSANLGSYAGATSTAAGKLSANAQNPLSGVSGVTGRYGSGAGSAFAGGISGMVYATKAASAQTAAAVNAMQVSGTNAWGQHLASNFAAGIRAGIGWVSEAANAIASAAKSILQFSVPDEGPWSGQEQGGKRSGLHLAQNFAAGMSSGAPEVQKAATRLALAASIGTGAGMAALPAASIPARSVQKQMQNVYNIGSITLDASRIRTDAALEDLVSALETAVRRA